MVGYIGSKAVTLSTTAADVTGDATINGNLTVKGTTVTIDSAAAQEIRLGDNDKMTFGDATGGDLQIYHDGSMSYIDDAGNGDLRIRANNDINFRNYSNDATVMNLSLNNGSEFVQLYYAGSQKLATTTTGVDISGTLTSDALNVSAASPNIDVTDTGTSHASQDFLTNSNAVRATIGVERSTGGGLFVGSSAYAAVFGTASSGSTQFATNNNVRMTIDSSGQVGIGTSSPSTPLHVKDSNGGLVQTIETGDSSAAYTKYINSTTGSGAFTDGLLVGIDTDESATFWQYEASHMKFGTSGTERMRISSSGTVLLGKTADNLTDAGQVFSTAGSSFTRSGGAACQFNRNTSDGEVIRLSKDGTTVGAVTTYNNTVQYGGALGSALYLDTSAYLPANAGGRTNSTIDIGSGTFKYKDAYLSGTVNAANFNTTSDATLKTNVETLTGSLDAVKALRGVSFDWIESGNSEVGVIAQEVEAVVPDVVSTDDQGIKSVKYGNLVGVLIEAIKEQQAQIDELKAQLNS